MLTIFALLQSLKIVLLIKTACKNAKSTNTWITQNIEHQAKNLAIDHIVYYLQNIKIT